LHRGARGYAHYRHHKYWYNQYRRHYNDYWRRRAWIATASIVVASLQPRTVYVYAAPAQYYYYPSTQVWYVKETSNGKEGYVAVSPPLNYEVDALPSDAKEVTVEDETYFYSAAERCFYTKIARDGKTRYVIVDAPLGALVDALPKDAVEHDEEGEKIYQYGDAYFVKETDDTGKSRYAVTAPPASEVIEADKLPEDAVTMEVDDKTYYYIDGAFYLPDMESGKSTYAVAEPAVGGNVKTVPDGAVVFTVDTTRYYQFDNVFFKDKPGGGYVIVAEPSSS